MEQAVKSRLEICPIRIKLFDGFSAETRTGERIEIKNRKACGILAYLALNHNHRESRERLAGLLWSDRSEPQARASLRQCLKQLREIFEEEEASPIRIERQDISLNPGSVRIDLDKLLRQATDGIIDDDLVLGRVSSEQILYGYEMLDTAFAAWLHVVRRQWQDRFVACLENSLRDPSADKTIKERAAQSLAHIDQTHEEAQRFLIAHFAETGNVPAALRQYSALWDLLDEDYGMEPAEETQQLIVQIKSGTYELSKSQQAPVEHPQVSVSAVQPVTVLENVQLPTLAVARFAPGAAVNRESYLIDGFRRDLIASLIRFRDWVVVDGGCEPRALSGHQESRKLQSGAEYEIEGTYFEHKGGLQLVVTLKNLSTQHYIWSERYDLTLEAWSSAQRQIVMRMSAGLNIHLSAQQVASYIAVPDISTDAYNLWLKGYHLIWNWDPAVRKEAEDIFRQVIDRSPSFAPAHSGLASIYSSRHMISPGVFPEEAPLFEAVDFAQRSVALDPLDVRSHVALAWANGMIGRFDQSELHHRLSYELNPTNPTTLVSCANGLAMCGDLESGRRMSDEALEITPSVRPGQWAYLASTRFICGDYEGCVDAASRAGDIIPMAPGWCTAAFGQLRREGEAEAAAKHFLEFMEDNWVSDRPFSAALAAEWFLRHCPLKYADVRTRMREGLAYAGLPVPD